MRLANVIAGFLLFFFFSPVSGQVKLIFDTDFGGDADDLGALAMLNHFYAKKEVDLLAVMCWNREYYAVSAIDAVNTFYGHPDIPIGRREGPAEKTDWNHSRPIAENLPHDAKADKVPEATALYRKLLSEAKDQSVVIVAVGPLFNIQRLIVSPPDDYSPLDGLSLINAKVKEFVIMGGNFPSGKQEWNFDGDMPGVTKYVLERMTLPLTFLGFELGAALKTGAVFNQLPKDSPLYLGFYHFSKYAPWMKEKFKGEITNNATFDQTAVLYAIRNGVGHYWRRVENGFCVADDTGGNEWQPRSRSNHSYLVLDLPVAEMEKQLESFMLGNF